MAIKQPSILTRQEFDQAMVHLRLNISEVSRETSIPRTYLSEFRNGDRQLRPENLAKLRDYFEGKGLEFEEEQQEVTEPAAPESTVVDPQTDPEGIQRALLAIRHLAIDPNLDRAQAEAILEKIARNDAKILEILSQNAEQGIWGELIGAWSDDTKSRLSEVFGLLAGCYLLVKEVQGRPLVSLYQPVKTDQLKTIADIVVNLYHEENAALIPTQQSQEEEQAEEVTE